MLTSMANQPSARKAATTQNVVRWARMMFPSFLPTMGKEFGKMKRQTHCVQDMFRQVQGSRERLSSHHRLEEMQRHNRCKVASGAGKWTFVC